MYMLQLKLFKTCAVSVCMFVCCYIISVVAPLASKRRCMYNHYSVLKGY